MDLDALRTFQNHLSHQAALNLKGAQWTPNKLMDCLKEPSPDTKGELTVLGSFVRALLPAPLTHSVGLIKWITFHLDYPGKPFGPRASVTRNWIAIHTQDRSPIDDVHSRILEIPEEELKHIYAPSLIARRFRDIPGLQEWVFKKRWLFRMRPMQAGACLCRMPPCKLPEQEARPETPFIPRNTVCFAPPTDDAISKDHIPLAVFSCGDTGKVEPSTTLNALLNEPQEVSARRFANFANLVLKVPGNKNPTGPWANYFLRIPKRWAGDDASYLTEVLVAFDAEKDHSHLVFALLDPLDTILSNVIALINSEVAFRVGALTEQREMAAFFGRILHHDLKNLDAAIGELVTDLHESWNTSTDTEKRKDLSLLEAELKLGFMLAGVNYAWTSREEFYSHTESLSALHTDLAVAARSEHTTFTWEGDWSSSVAVPLGLRSVFANLIWNIKNDRQNAKALLSVRLGDNQLTFCVGNTTAMPPAYKATAFDLPYSPQMPEDGKGLWICRTVVHKVCGGTWKLLAPQNDLQTIIEFTIPRAMQHENPR